MSVYIQIGTNNGNDAFLSRVKRDHPDLVILVEPNKEWRATIRKYYEYVSSVSGYVSGYTIDTTISLYCGIANNEDKAGEFGVKGRVITYNITTNEKMQESISEKLYSLVVLPKQTKSVGVIIQNILPPTNTTKRIYECLAYPPTKEVCKEETTYKDVIKRRTLTKYATLFQQWIGQAKYYYRI